MTMIQLVRYSSFLVATFSIASLLLIVQTVVSLGNQTAATTIAAAAAANNNNNQHQTTNASPFPPSLLQPEGKDAIREAYEPYTSANGYSLAVSLLDKEVRAAFERQILDAFGIDNVPTNVTGLSVNSYALMYAQTIYSKYNDKTSGGFKVRPEDTIIKTPGFPQKRLSYGIQEAINKSDTIVTCTGPQRPTVDGLWACDVSPTIQNSVGVETPIHTAQFMLLTSRGIWETRDVTSYVEKWTRFCTPELRIMVDIEDIQDDIQYSFLVIYMTTKNQRPKPRTTMSQNTQTAVPSPSTTSTTTPSSATPIPTTQAENWTRQALQGMKTLDNTPRKRRSVKTQVSGSSTSNRTSGGRTSSLMRPVMNPYHSKYCNIFNMDVDFKQLRWNDWIIAPDSYGAYYCSGECPFPLPPSLGSSNHAIMQMLVHHMDKSVPKPCCVATKLLPISVLYYDDYSNVILKSYKNMIARSCGCL